ncbi:g6454 [Coccomyxa elongata]
MGRHNSSPAGALAPSSRSSTQEEDAESPAVAGSSKGLLSDKYTLGEELGRGAYGQVFKGTDVRTGELVAIKQMSLSGISQDNLQGIMGEIDLLKNLNHRNIVKYVGSFKTRTHLYIILEYMEKGSLSDVIRPSKFGAFPEPLVAVYIGHVLQGLAYLHQQGVVHRDIKGANILTGNEGVVKLADFGVAAKLTELEEGGDSLRVSVVGTPYWMAPEVIEMTCVTAAADIWSVGCLAIELLTGQPPYFDLQPMSALFRIVQDEHPTLPDSISIDMADFLLACFQKDPQARPDARALLGHAWLRSQRATLRASWSKTVGARARGHRTDAHASVSSVVERILRADSEESASNGPGSETDSQQSEQTRATHMRKDSAKSMESRLAKPLTEQDLQRASTKSSSSIGMDRIPQRPSLLGSALQQPSSVDSDGGLVTPAQQREPQRPSTHKTRPPPLDTTQQGLTAAPFNAGPLGGLLAQLGSSSLQHPATAGQEVNLLGWLQEREQQSGGAGPVGSPKPAALAPDTDSSAPKHQQAAEVRRLVAALRPAGRGGAAGGAASARDSPTVDACQQLAALFAEHPDRRAIFLAQDGIVAIIELLEERSHKVALAALELANAVVADDAAALEAACLLGLVPAVTRYCFSAWPTPLRAQAANFVHALCYTSLATARMFVACQGIPVLVSLVEDRIGECGHLTQTGIRCVWHVLELHGAAALNHLCRLLAADGFPYRLLRALNAIISDMLASPTGMQVQESPAESRYAASEASTASVAEDTSLDEEVHSRAASNSQASSSRAAGPGSSRLSSIGLTSYFKPGRPGGSGDPFSPAVQQQQQQQLPPRSRQGSSMKGAPSHRRGGSWAASDAVSDLIDIAGNLLLVLAHGDSVVKGCLGRRDTLLAMFEVMRRANAATLLKCLKCLKLLTFDPALLQPLQDAGSIPVLLPYLGRRHSAAVQLEALHALYNLCKISRTRQEAAAVAGIVPYLAALAQPQGASTNGEGTSAQLRPLAVSLLCGMAHSTQRTRAELWAQNGLDLLLSLLKQQMWQGPALDALAAWLAEDGPRVEPRLASREACQRFVALFAAYAPAGDSEALSRLLDAFLRILRRSPRITVEVGQGGLAPLVVDMLGRAGALTQLQLLQVLRALYEYAPRPKQFVVQHGLAECLRGLAQGGGRGASQSVLVRKQALSILQALQVHTAV